MSSLNHEISLPTARANARDRQLHRGRRFFHFVGATQCHIAHSFAVIASPGQQWKNGLDLAEGKVKSVRVEAEVAEGLASILIARWNR